ncbi:MAG: NADP-dependent phosphogluconate dehydrogenase [Rhodobacterales bacterium]
MGAALALNIAEKGHDIAVFNRTPSKTRDFMADVGELAPRLTPTETLEDFVQAIATPRTIILMVLAGEPVDEQIALLEPLLDADDLVIDAGNANFHDTNRRMRTLKQPFLGIGVSGGEEGARHGPAIMGGGPKSLWNRVEPVLHAISAKHKDEPCADWMGEEGAGHFVKAVHNGIEYADMQLIAEAYGIMRDGLGLDAQAIADTFAKWNDGPLRSYLIEISGIVAGTTDAATNGPILDVILDSAGQKGTGRWTAIEAQHLGAPIPVIEAAVAARNMSARKDERGRMEAIFGAAPQGFAPAEMPLEGLEQALICGKILCYDQGFRLIAAASDQFGWSLDGARIARVWREGCIIRSDMLDDMAAALSDSGVETLMAAPVFADHLKSTQAALRQVIATAVSHGAPVPALSSALSYLDTMRTHRGTANMIQGQRDYFGRHGFVRLDDGQKDQHGPWAG